MNWVTTIATIVGSAVAVATFVNAVIQYRRKIHMEIFRTYADRYNAIITPEIYEKWLAAVKGNQSYWTELNPTMIRYLNLIWEEFFLSRDKVIPGRLWRLWLPEVNRVLASEFARSVLETHNFHFPADLTIGWGSAGEFSRKG
jgi:hypothetical protein